MNINSPDTDFLYELASIINWDLIGSCLFFFSQGKSHVTIMTFQNLPCTSLENIGLSLWNFGCWFQLFANCLGYLQGFQQMFMEGK